MSEVKSRLLQVGVSSLVLKIDPRRLHESIRKDCEEDKRKRHDKSQYITESFRDVKDSRLSDHI